MDEKYCTYLIDDVDGIEVMQCYKKATWIITCVSKTDDMDERVSDPEDIRFYSCDDCKEVQIDCLNDSDDVEFRSVLSMKEWR